MTDETGTQTLTPQASLGDVVLQAKHSPSSSTDRWLGKRFDARTALSVPAWIRLPADDEYGPTLQATIRDVSMSGLGLFANQAMRTDEVVLVRFSINDTCWSGPMRVRHCTETIGGYKIGLQAMEERSVRMEPKAQPAGTVNTGPFPAGDLRPASLARIKAEARKAAQAYHLARFSWGLLGSSIRHQIQRVINEMSTPSNYVPPLGRRRKARNLVESGTAIVFRMPHCWRQAPARIVDVSQEGIGLLLPNGLVDDPVERDMVGDLKPHVAMILIIGMGSGPQRLWIPGEVMNCSPAKDGRVRAGIQFATPTAQAMFNT